MNINEQTSTLNLCGREVTISTGLMAKQANGSVVVSCGNTTLLATATMSKSPKEGIDFFPLTVEFSEKMYASGKIPGGFFKREARPTTQATLTSRLIDRPLRPTFPKGLYNDVQIIITTLSYDPEIPVEALAIIAASAAVSVSDIPFNGPVGAANVGYINGQLVANPSSEQLKESDLNIVVAGTKDAILMIESNANELPEETIIDAILLAHEHIKESITLQEDLIAKAGKEKGPVPAENEELNTLVESVRNHIGDKIKSNLTGGNKSEVETFLSDLEAEVTETFINEDETNADLVKQAFAKVKKEQIRSAIITNKVRPDGRETDEIRPLDIRVGVLPGVHGSALFTRGETQSLGVTTLGTSDDEQQFDGLSGKESGKYYFHYNFPPYSVGECGRLSTGRRELGHGALAERALKAVVPGHDEFPYTIRQVSEILESNGSSSMASVCSGSLAMMDCGVPLKASVSGIAMGLLLEGEDYVILSDIQGLEDHYGDMDFKVAGTEKGITALQLDIKIAGLSKQILEEALGQAKKGRLEILYKMNDVIKESRPEISPNAPKLVTFFIDPEKVGLVIGPGGKTIRNLEEVTEAGIIITDGSKGEVSISGKNQEVIDNAIAAINNLVKDVEVGDVVDGKVTKVVNFGAFVELKAGKEGLIHISKLSKDRIENINDFISVGDPLKVRVNEIDRQNRINLVLADA